jgi:hypothetical protein
MEVITVLRPMPVACIICFDAGITPSSLAVVVIQNTKQHPDVADGTCLVCDSRLCHSPFAEEIDSSTPEPGAISLLVATAMASFRGVGLGRG